jgi:hypothetical protein
MESMGSVLAAAAMFLFSSLEPGYCGFHPSTYLRPEDDYAPLHAAEVKSVWSYTFISPHIILA